MTGRIIKGIGGFYYAMNEQGVFECKARGKFRIEELSPFAGDVVEFENGCLIKICERKNKLLRPPVCNVDQLALVLAASKPQPDMLLIDKLLIQAAGQGVSPLIVLNKLDEAESDFLRSVIAQYSEFKSSFIMTSAKTGEGVRELEARLKNKLTCFAGQSAVGKSSLINMLCRRVELPTGELSRKSGRGRHTTRASELLTLDCGGYVLDTPGFSLLELNCAQPELVQSFYPEIARFEPQCRFARCLHDKEPDCAVKLALERGEITKERYARYIELLNEAKKQRRNMYD